MQFESKIKPSLWLGSIAGVILDVSISIVLASPFDGGTTGFFAALLGLQFSTFRRDLLQAGRRNTPSLLLTRTAIALQQRERP